MSPTFWIIMLIVLSSIVIFIATGIVIFTKVIYKYKNGFVARIHMEDSTFKTKRFHIIPIDNKFEDVEVNSKGEEKPFTYNIKSDCIEKGNWGKYSDYDYQVANPRPLRSKSDSPLLSELKELFKLISAMLDTDLYTKLMRSSGFESFVKTLLVIILIISIIGASFAGIAGVKSLITKSNNKCTLELDSNTWKVLYVGTNTPPPVEQPTPQSSNKR